MNKYTKYSVKVLFLLFGIILSMNPLSADERVAKDGDTVSINYTGKLEDNTVFDASKGRGPLKFKVGTEQIIPGMNNAVRGMKVGEKKTVSIPPTEAYGNRNEKLIFDIPLKQLPQGVKPGSKLMNPQGHPVTVKEINGENAVLDANHFLAGKTLIFDIEMVSID